LWWFIEAPALSRSAAAVLADPANRVLVSAVSAYELAYKHRLGKLEQAETLLGEFEKDLVGERFQQHEVSIAHALRAGRLPWPHKDPFDRLLVAQALADDLTLVSNEALFDATGVRRLW
jgi:PIN domain nuclease of toxin-antitoxin system